MDRSLYYLLQITVIICIGCFLPTTAQAASFDCAKASSALEKAICTDGQINKADEDLAKYYFKLKNSLDKQRSKILLNEQRKWLKQRQTLCNTGDVLCLRKLYSDRIQALRIRHENIVPFESGHSGAFQGLRGTCEFADVKFPDEYLIYAAGWYSGRKLDVQIDQSGHEATRFDIIVNSPSKPVVLIFGAYEPSIWNVGWTKDTVILAVVVTGYHRQAVAGLPNDMPILISTYHNGGLCRHIYPNGRNQENIDAFSQSLFKKPPDATYLVGGGKAVLGIPVKQEEPLFSSADVAVDRFIDRTAPLAGPSGIKDAVKQGILRPATQEDREAWIKLKTESMSKKRIGQIKDPFRAGIEPIISDTFYVILKPFRLPAGLSGGNSVEFFLPKGVPFPEGDVSHCHIYDFNTMKCHGGICDR